MNTLPKVKRLGVRDDPTDFSIIHRIYCENGQWYIKDTIGRLFRFEDVTDDGLAFYPKWGWLYTFVRPYDIALIRRATAEGCV